VDFRLTPNQSLDIEIGDTYDETGVSGNAKSIQSELDGATDYVFCAYAYGSTPGTGSPLSVTLDRATTAQGSNCTFTQGYWKNHPDQWPVSSLTLGTGPGVSYTVAELLQIFNEPVNSNGLVALAHQLIAAKLNIANGANPTAISATIANDDAMIGNLVVPPIGGGSLPTSQTSNDTQTLDDWNSGITGPGHCGETPAHNPTWGALKAKYR
jgi:hypothetical protein